MIDTTTEAERDLAKYQAIQRDEKAMTLKEEIAPKTLDEYLALPELERMRARVNGMAQAVVGQKFKRF